MTARSRQRRAPDDGKIQTMARYGRQRDLDNSEIWMMARSGQDLDEKLDEIDENHDN